MNGLAPSSSIEYIPNSRALLQKHEQFPPSLKALSLAQCTFCIVIVELYPAVVVTVIIRLRTFYFPPHLLNFIN